MTCQMLELLPVMQQWDGMLHHLQQWLASRDELLQAGGTGRAVPHRLPCCSWLFTMHHPHDATPQVMHLHISELQAVSCGGTGCDNFCKSLLKC